jgi:hypothetical protein
MRTTTILAAAALAAAVAAGCGGGSSSGSASTSTARAVNPNAPEASPAGDIPDNQAYVPYSPPGGGYSVKVPEGWARTSSGGATTFTDKLNSIRMESLSASSAPTVAGAQSTELPKLTAATPGLRAAKVSQVKRSAGPVVLIAYEAASKPDPVTGKRTVQAVERYEFFKNGKEVVLTLSAPKGADNVDPWKIVTDSLRYTG